MLVEVFLLVHRHDQVVEEVVGGRYLGSRDQHSSQLGFQVDFEFVLKPVSYELPVEPLDIEEDVEERVRLGDLGGEVDVEHTSVLAELLVEYAPQLPVQHCSKRPRHGRKHHVVQYILHHLFEWVVHRVVVVLVEVAVLSQPPQERVEDYEELHGEGFRVPERPGGHHGLRVKLLNEGDDELFGTLLYELPVDFVAFYEFGMLLLCLLEPHVEQVELEHVSVLGVDQAYARNESGGRVLYALALEEEVYIAGYRGHVAIREPD